MTETKIESIDDVRKKLGSLVRRAHSTVDGRVADVLALEQRSGVREDGLRGELRDAARSTLVALGDVEVPGVTPPVPAALRATLDQAGPGEVSYSERFQGDGREISLGLTLPLSPGQDPEDAWGAIRNRVVAFGLHEVRDLATLAAISPIATPDAGETADT
jgi:hypothetical protein